MRVSSGSPTKSPTPSPTKAPTKKPTKAPTYEAAVCAAEGESCQCTGVVSFTAKSADHSDKFALQTSVGSIWCDNAVFGDPAPGIEKHCLCNSGEEPPNTDNAFNWGKRVDSKRGALRRLLHSDFR